MTPHGFFFFISHEHELGPAGALPLTWATGQGQGERTRGELWPQSEPGLEATTSHLCQDRGLAPCCPPKLLGPWLVSGAHDSEVPALDDVSEACRLVWMCLPSSQCAQDPGYRSFQHAFLGAGSERCEGLVLWHSMLSRGLQPKHPASEHQFHPGYRDPAPRLCA